MDQKSKSAEYLHIRNLGYPARTHIDGNYRVVCPLVARDAGIGEIGRMGLLMTPRLGPRVRIAVVCGLGDGVCPINTRSAECPLEGDPGIPG
ncbi:MAG: hypothetical protein ACE5OP_06150 [Candidatus Glassbacteria bacterium]